MLHESSAPYPVSHRVVDDDAPEDDEHDERGEPQTLGKSADDQGGRDDCEHTLEEHERQFGDVGSRFHGVNGDAMHETLVKPTDDSS